MNLGARKRARRQFFSLDIDPSSRIHALEVLQQFDVEGRAYFFHGGLEAFRDKMEIAPTLAFIDGDHTYEGVRRDVNQLSSMLRSNVPVVFHDYLNPDTPGVLRAVNEWIEQGFAVLRKTCGTCAVTSTTAKCAGRSAKIGEKDFAELVASQKPRLVTETALIRAKSGIARRLPWLVPIVRTLKGRTAKR